MLKKRRPRLGDRLYLYTMIEVLFTKLACFTFNMGHLAVPVHHDWGAFFTNVEYFTFNMGQLAVPVHHDWGACTTLEYFTFILGQLAVPVHHD